MNGREQMIKVIESSYGLDSPKVLLAMSKVPREKFVPKKYWDVAYNDGPVPIGHNQTMSQPYTVAFMTHLLLEMDKPHFAKASRGKKVWGKKVLEIGTGSGYQAAVLSKLVKEVYTVEIIDELAKRAEKKLSELGYDNVYVKSGSGEWGWREHAPYDGILVTCGIEGKIPQDLFGQLKVEGVLVAPVGRGYDKIMTRFIKTPKRQNSKIPRIKKEEFGIFHFVPFVKEKVED